MNQPRTQQAPSDIPASLKPIKWLDVGYLAGFKKLSGPYTPIELRLMRPFISPVFLIEDDHYVPPNSIQFRNSSALLTATVVPYFSLRIPVEYKVISLPSGNRTHVMRSTESFYLSFRLPP